MRHKWNGLSRQGIRAGVVLVGLLTFSPSLFAQSCTTQARMTPDVRDGLSAAALTLAQAVHVADVTKVQGLTIADLEAAWEYAAAHAEEIDESIRANEAGEEGFVE